MTETNVFPSYDTASARAPDVSPIKPKPQRAPKVEDADADAKPARTKRPASESMVDEEAADADANAEPQGVMEAYNDAIVMLRNAVIRETADIKHQLELGNRIIRFKAMRGTANYPLRLIAKVLKLTDSGKISDDERMEIMLSDDELANKSPTDPAVREKVRELAKKILRMRKREDAGVPKAAKKIKPGEERVRTRKEQIRRVRQLNV